MARASWKGFLRLSLVSVPVQAHTATASGGGKITLNQLHAPCGSRIRYQKTCPIHGEVPNDEIVRGYEYTKGQYAVIDLDELDKLRSEADKAINIEQFFSAAELDPIYYAGSTYYLTPDGPAGQKPYRLMQQAMVDQEVYALAQVVFSGKEQLVVLRPSGQLLTISALRYESELKQLAPFEGELATAEFTAKEMQLTRTLVDATTTDELDLSQYSDLYTERLTALVEAKVEGREIVVPPEVEGPAVVNLMDALRASLDQTQKAASSKKKMAGRSAPRKPTKKSKAG